MSGGTPLIIKWSHTLGIIITMIIAFAGLCYGYGSNTKQTEQNTLQIEKLTVKLDKLNDTVQRLSARDDIGFNIK